MADVQLEHGYTRIANDILEHMARIKLSPTQYRILFLVWRCTYGFQKKEHDMSLSYISEATGLDKRNIRRELKSLEDKKIIYQNIKNGSYRKLSFNKNYDEWVGEIEPGAKLTMGETDNATMGEINNTTMGETDNQKRNYLKKNIKKKDTEEETLLKRILDILEKSEILGEKGITEFLRDDISDIIDTFGFEDPEKMIVEAIKDSARGNGKTWKYVYKKLVAWKKQGIKSVSDLEKLQDEEAATPKRTPRKGYGKAPIRQEVIPEYMNQEYVPKEADSAQTEAKKQSIKDKLNQFRGG
ncbi:replication protein [Neobacillus sp. 3P2-tot-E-2]|uniref:replication protein n=1 Tax=Neobacillus sp. 3P2-tot-E-2 TaxID=3132212 RepID=UPI0039A24D92